MVPMTSLIGQPSLVAKIPSLSNLSEGRTGHCDDCLLLTCEGYCNCGLISCRVPPNQIASHLQVTLRSS
ncbi:hypothetical protein RSOLAG1IB_08943 [Rhizoctonia solani AG-1 IB]|uniref:Uncharacterized protein n=1 Tax=Thanatephorus cucumeris (strain AG1-IB / isolate 7/3/14) TaxID=1108050 RepID=A0A0B7FRW3_THACB|nr:hypothetical protein RSOLAG1IB_08943 [Rhizoctonia solani AG-1 IB]